MLILVAGMCFSSCNKLIAALYCRLVATHKTVLIIYPSLSEIQASFIKKQTKCKENNICMGGVAGI